MDWLTANAGTIFTTLILSAIVFLSVHSMVKDKKAGKSLQCGMDCKHCGGHCCTGQKENP